MHNKVGKDKDSENYTLYGYTFSVFKHLTPKILHALTYILKYSTKKYLMTEAEGLYNILLPFFVIVHKTHISLSSKDAQTTSNCSESPDQIPSRTDQPWNTSKRSATVLDLHWNYSSVAGLLLKLWSPSSHPVKTERLTRCCSLECHCKWRCMEREVSLTPYMPSES